MKLWVVETLGRGAAKPQAYRRASVAINGRSLPTRNRNVNEGRSSNALASAVSALLFLYLTLPYVTLSSNARTCLLGGWSAGGIPLLLFIPHKMNQSDLKFAFVCWQHHFTRLYTSQLKRLSAHGREGAEVLTAPYGLDHGATLREDPAAVRASAASTPHHSSGCRLGLLRPAGRPQQTLRQVGRGGGSRSARGCCCLSVRLGAVGWSDG